MTKSTFDRVTDSIVEPLVPVFRAEMLRRMDEEWGERCPDFEPGCACCRAWAFYDQYGVCPTNEQLPQHED